VQYLTVQVAGLGLELTSSFCLWATVVNVSPATVSGTGSAAGTGSRCWLPALSFVVVALAWREN